MKLGLIGEKLPHSYSKEIFENILGYPAYDLIELKPEEVGDFVAHLDRNGVNVTVPYKTAVLPYLDDVTDLARRIGAVNTIWRADGKLHGTNTDYYGLSALLRRAGFDLAGKTVLILGTGGTSKTAAAVCADLGAARIVKVSRTEREGAISYGAAARVRAHYIINTTPCGMFPKTEVSPIDLQPFLHPETPSETLLGVADVVYHPIHTALIRQAKELGIPAVSGLYMLAAQAVAAERYFTGRTADEAETAACAERVYRALRGKKSNLVLIGMPASGKSTVGAALAERTGRPFFDTDEELTKQIGPIAAFIRENGEEAFRNAETETIRALTSRVRGAVVATGGGAVLRAENRRMLAENGFLIWLDREPEETAFDPTRPLSDTREKREALRRVREPIYRAAADLTVQNFATPEEACNRIWKEYCL